MPDSTRAAEGRRELILCFLIVVALLIGASAQALRVDEEDEVGGVGKSSEGVDQRSNSSRPPIAGGVSSSVGDVGAVGRDPPRRPCAVPKSSMFGSTDGEEGGKDVVCQELREIGHQPVQNNCVICPGAVCRKGQDGAWRLQTDIRLVRDLDCRRLS